jgi:hypothetical protein
MVKPHLMIIIILFTVILSSDEKMKYSFCACSLLKCGFVRSVFTVEDGDDRFLRNAANHLQDYTVLQPSRPRFKVVFIPTTALTGRDHV